MRAAFGPRTPGAQRTDAPYLFPAPAARHLCRTSAHNKSQAPSEGHREYAAPDGALNQMGCVSYKDSAPTALRHSSDFLRLGGLALNSSPRPKAVLKPRAVQTLRDCRTFSNLAKRLECGRVHRRFSMPLKNVPRSPSPQEWFSPMNPHPAFGHPLPLPRARESGSLPRGGRITSRLTRRPATGFAGRLTAKPEKCERCSFSPGEKVRMRAGVSTNFASPLHITSEVTPRKGTRPTRFCRPAVRSRRIGLMTLCIVANKLRQAFTSSSAICTALSAAPLSS